MTSPAVGALLGLVAGTGLWLIVSGVPVGRRIDLVQRLEPYLRDGAHPTRSWPDGGGSLVARLLGPFRDDVLRLAERLSGTPRSVRRRLDQAGSPLTVEDFRAQQVLWGAGGVLAGIAVALLIAVARGPAVLPMLMVVVIGGLSGFLLRDQVLSWQVTRREQRMMQEFPTVAELLALSVGAGEGAIGALERVSRTCSGELTRELGRALAAARAGASLIEALEGLATRTNLAPLARFVDGVAIAVERGTPLADVLRAQAQDVREAARRELMEQGGRKEIAMMVPVVFLVLPVTVLFAVYPGLLALRLQF